MSPLVANRLFPPFTRETALLKVRATEDLWNSRDPESVSLDCSLDSRWRDRTEFLYGRDDIVAFLTRKWKKDLDYRLIRDLWAYQSGRISARFAYEWHDAAGQWYRSYGNEDLEFAEDGLMLRRIASINDLKIKESERLFRWPAGPRPAEHPGLSELGL